MSESSLSSFLNRSRISLCISVSSVSVSVRCFRARCLSTSDSRSSILVSFARLFANSSLTPAIAFSSPASSLLAWVTHTVSICLSSGWSQLVLRFDMRCRLCRRCPRVRCFQGCSGGFNLSAGVLSHRSYSDLFSCNQRVRTISAVHLYHPPRTSRPVLITPGTEPRPSS